ncbi:SRPBCC family protein [Mycolicibacterium farcinogenes]|uniref:SRPBCC family protein n=1 Tax=Mycolicibacterium farcinogenes TaxID=1802 RepID=UPI001C8DBBA5|nr:SRPBCC family protein [Mycolicibacterium farcinogenes]QZH61773.1 SRPBCC family protein [Mycolicibacterium farcinogenes]
MGRPYRYTDVRRIPADPAVVWSIVANHEGMSEWTPSRKVVLEAPGNPDRYGVGAIRALHMFGPVIRERITRFEPPTTLQYRLVSGLPFREYTGQITVEPTETGSLMSAVISFRTIIPGTQILVAIAIRVASAGAARLARRRPPPR